ncbi:MAG TPA: tRNA (adenosine(37)-N6)-threonylcarbamoyltransferase complex transferase subunit TsaD [Nitrospirota bacterium]|nr:tRNA (adenosine(37)-N6)-threonylcarbamoyltransferase complex transferase subunit TsaD [Nitrospirota bacterium]
MLILGIETSCDETAAAVVEDGKKILSNVVSSQVELHAKYGGIVPELASRAHIENIMPVVHEALEASGKKLGELDGVAVTVGPGLIGALLVGVSAAKALAYSAGIPLAGVNHIEGHLSAIFLESDEVYMPFVLLVVSGGHTHLYLVRGWCEYEKLGQTRDDAAGEAYDKVAKLLKLGYPGGPIIDRLSREASEKDMASGLGRAGAIKFPRTYLEPGSFDFSFSGLKTAVMNHVKGLGPAGPTREQVAEICSSFQEAVVDVLVKKTVGAAKATGVDGIVVAGGVASNGALRSALKEAADAAGKKLLIPSPALCTDNAAMVAAAGYHLLRLGRTAGLDLNPQANLPLEKMRVTPPLSPS